MSDLFGLLPLPAFEPSGEEDALTDPLLDMLLAFMKAVLNYDLQDAWASVVPTDPTPVRYVFNHAPNMESFNMDDVPALYAWRADDSGSFRYSQDLVADETGFQVIWVPPALPQEKERYIVGIRNGIKKSLKAAFAQGRHPGWVLDGDDYYDPEDYGSVLLHHAKIAKVQLGAFRQQPLLIESADKSFRKTFDSLLFGVTTLEFFKKDLTVEQPLLSLNGTMGLAIGGDRAHELTTLSYTVDPTPLSLDVITGPAAGGTPIVITGKQLDVDGPDDAEIAVYFGTGLQFAAGTEVRVDPDHLELVDETTINIVSPPHAAGLVSLRVVFPSGVVKTLTDAFTYTP